MKKDRIVKPFLRWAGGKNWLTKNLEQNLPSNFNNYHEPFLGGGSVFFYLKNRNLLANDSILSDVNSSLIECYIALRDSPEAVINELKQYRNDPETYYAARATKFSNNYEEAAKFIFLNRTSFNGIYRENLKGEYNVPFGFKTYKELFDFENLMLASEALQDTNIQTADFVDCINNCRDNDFIFLDPPYTVAHENNGFVKYNQKIFSWDDQVKLKNSVIELNENGVKYILTNAYHSSLLELYDNVGIGFKLERHSVVGGNKAKREKYNELLITNING